MKAIKVINDFTTAEMFFSAVLSIFTELFYSEYFIERVFWGFLLIGTIKLTGAPFNPANLKEIKARRQINQKRNVIDGIYLNRANLNLFTISKSTFEELKEAPIVQNMRSNLLL